MLSKLVINSLQQFKQGNEYTLNQKLPYNSMGYISCTFRSAISTRIWLEALSYHRLSVNEWIIMIKITWNQLLQNEISTQNKPNFASQKKTPHFCFLNLVMFNTYLQAGQLCNYEFFKNWSIHFHNELQEISTRLAVCSPIDPPLIRSEIISPLPSHPHSSTTARTGNF